MNHTAFLAGAFFLSFLFYVTVKGDLGKWLGMLGLAPTPASSGTAAGAGAASGPLSGITLPPLPGLGNLLGTAGTILGQ